MQGRYAVVDLFAGPGGLAEGFSSFSPEDKSRPFKIALSVEKEKPAHSTLLLRSFLRQFDDGYPQQYYDFLNNNNSEPDWRKIYPDQWTAACSEAQLLTLGDVAASDFIDRRIGEIRDAHGDDTIVIGGPPCQAYSLVGRARNTGIATYVARDDPRHYLYKTYIDILSKLRPAAFVMENVKGMLSSSVDGVPIFGKVLENLRSAAGADSYRLLALSPQRHASGRLPLEPVPSDFILRAEDFGVPQSRHRVIILGVRRDLADGIDENRLCDARLQPHERQARVSDVLDGMPPLRSGLSRGQDSAVAWRAAFRAGVRAVLDSAFDLMPGQEQELRAVLNNVLALEIAEQRGALRPNGLGTRCPSSLANWLRDPRLEVLPNNETRGHMPSDLGRYLFASAFGKVTGRSPKAGEFPAALAPAHRNWETGKFSDRFRVQIADAPSTTVTSHISKDGHYFIHPDPAQCRSLTVREAARLQTFPDNYYFKGNRTEQFVQVGNAVPPYLAMQIAGRVHDLLIAAGQGAEHRVRCPDETLSPPHVSRPRAKVSA
ncbi:MAG: DNA cytosine methyltransferase [Sphingomonadaceae bacterium]|jgi:DNA (cytosine-5)-methyltransferase 1